jgi:hypothetical protein
VLMKNELMNDSIMDAFVMHSVAIFESFDPVQPGKSAMIETSHPN